MKRFNRILAALLAALMLCGACATVAEMNVELNLDAQANPGSIELEIDPESGANIPDGGLALDEGLQLDGVDLSALDPKIDLVEGLQNNYDDEDEDEYYDEEEDEDEYYDEEEDEDDSDSDFEIDENGVLVKYKGKGGDVTIPASVTSIGEDAFWKCKSLTSVTIPNSVTSIGEYAFWACYSLTSVTIPNSVTSIGKYAFSNCESLTSVTIPDSVTSIGEDAFGGCDHLETINVAEGNRNYTSKGGILYTHDMKTLLQCPGAKTSVTIPDSVTRIGEYAFLHCESLTSVTIPNSVTSIGKYAFCYCKSLTSVTIPDSVTSIGEDAFKYCTSLTSVTIPNSVTSIGENAFCGCDHLETINVAEGNRNYTSKGGILYTHDMKTLLQGPGAKTSVTIPSSVISIGAYAFNECSSLTSVTIPNSVTSIGVGAFSNCESLTSVTILAKSIDIDDDFYGSYPTFHIISGSDAIEWAEDNDYNYDIIKEGLSEKTLKLVSGKTHQLNVYDTGKKVSNAAWSSSDKSVAAVNNGKVTAKKVGKCVISATLESGRTFKCNVTVYDPAELSDKTLTLNMGETYKLKITGLLKRTVTWTSSDTAVATVKNGKITPKKAGKCTITAKLSKSQYIKARALTCKLTVTDPAVLSETTLSLQMGSTHTLTITGLAKRKVTWTSSNTSVATVKDGKVTAIKAGKCTIKAQIKNGKKLTCKLTVTDPAALSKDSLIISTVDFAKIRLTGRLKRKVTWSTSDADVVKITKSDADSVTFRAVNRGEATVTAKVEGGKALKCAVTVVSPLTIKEDWDDDFDDLASWEVGVKFTNHSNKKIIYVTFDILQYNNRGDKLQSPYDYYYFNNDLDPHSSRWDNYQVNDDTRSVKFKIREVTFDDKTTWRP